MSKHSNRFWGTSHRYEELAKQYEKHIEIRGAHGFYECELGWGGHCPYCATNAKYVEYKGPSV